MTVPKLKRDVEGGVEVAVLVSPGFGAGWASWNENTKETLLFHEDLVKLVLEGKREAVAALAEEICGDDYLYTGGAADLEVYWVPEGSRFIINEYDGSESLSLESRFSWSVA